VSLGDCTYAKEMREVGPPGWDIHQVEDYVECCLA
jgi:hypothetical protein